MYTEVLEKLARLFLEYSSKVECFYSSDEEAYDFIEKHVDENYEVSINNKHYSIKEAAELGLIKYDEMVFINKDYEIDKDDELLIETYNTILDKNEHNNLDINNMILFLSEFYMGTLSFDSVKKSKLDCAGFIANNNDDNIINKFNYDYEFAKEIILNFYKEAEIENVINDLNDTNNVFVSITDMENNIDTKHKEVNFINEIYRNILIDIYKYLLTISVNENNAIEFLASHLSDDIRMNDSFYEKYFGKTKVNVKALITIQKLLVISDYFKSTNLKENLRITNNADKDYMEYIRKSELKDLITLFDEDLNFYYVALKEFIRYNNELKKYNIETDKKILRKINPLYKMDEFTNTIN